MHYKALFPVSVYSGFKLCPSFKLLAFMLIIYQVLHIFIGLLLVSHTKLVTVVDEHLQQIPFTKICGYSYSYFKATVHVVLGGLVVSVLVIRHKVSGFKLGRGRQILRAIKIH
jgi:hypothetical protein